MHALNETLNELGFELIIDKDIDGAQLKYVTENDTKYYFYIDNAISQRHIIYELLQWTKQYDAIKVLKDEYTLEALYGLAEYTLCKKELIDHYLELVEIEEKMKDLHQRLLEGIL